MGTRSRKNPGDHKKNKNSGKKSYQKNVRYHKKENEENLEKR